MSRQRHNPTTQVTVDSKLPSNPCVYPANVRFYFETTKAGGFDETQYWWSNTLPTFSAILATNGTMILKNTFDGANWSDFYGHPRIGPHATAFNAALSNVTAIGVSFGGGCGFENGVGTTDGSGTFTLNNFTVS